MPVLCFRLSDLPTSGLGGPSAARNSHGKKIQSTVNMLTLLELIAYTTATETASYIKFAVDDKP